MEADISTLRKSGHFYFALTRRLVSVGEAMVSTASSISNSSPLRRTECWPLIDGHAKDPHRALRS